MTFAIIIKLKIYKISFNKRKSGVLMKYNTVIFDLDGTLLNTLEDLTDSVNFALDKFNFPKRTIEEIRIFVGNGVKVLMDRAVPAGTAPEITEQCLSTYRRHYSENLQNKTKPYDGILDLLAELKLRNFKIAVVSNKFDAAVKELCSQYYGNYIHVAIGESAGVAKKPAPDSVFNALEQLKSKKEETIYVGDSDVDVHTAHNAALKCVGVTWGFRDRDVLSNEGADYIIDKPMELIDILF